MKCDFKGSFTITTAVAVLHVEVEGYMEFVSITGDYYFSPFSSQNKTCCSSLCNGGTAITIDFEEYVFNFKRETGYEFEEIYTDGRNEFRQALLELRMKELLSV